MSDQDDVQVIEDKRSRSRSPYGGDAGEGDHSRPARRRYSDNPRRDGDSSRARSRSRSPRPRRDRDDDDDDDNINYEMRLLLPSKDAGAVIGKGGSNINKMRSECRARITFASSRTPERVLIACGNFSALRHVADGVYRAIEEKYRTGRRNADVTAKLLIHQSQAGCVIGKAGGQLKEFRHQYGVDIKVFAQCCPQSTERITQMIGRVSGVTKCIVHICKMLNGWPPKGFQSSYDPESYDPGMVPEYGGYEDEERMFNGGGRFGGGGRDRDSDYYEASLRQTLASLVPKKQTQKVSIPSDLAGVIIGKGGTKIRQIRQDSGAEVELSDVALPGDRIITISGTPDQIQNAQYLLQTCVKQHLALNRND